MICIYEKVMHFFMLAEIQQFCQQKIVRNLHSYAQRISSSLNKLLIIFLTFKHQNIVNLQ